MKFQCIIFVHKHHTVATPFNTITLYNMEYTTVYLITFMVIPGTSICTMAFIWLALILCSFFNHLFCSRLVKSTQFNKYCCFNTYIKNTGCLYVCLYVCVCVYICVCVCIYIYIYIKSHIFIINMLMGTWAASMCWLL